MQHREAPLDVIALILYMKVDLGQRMKCSKGLADSRGLQDLFLPVSYSCNGSSDSQELGVIPSRELAEDCR